MKKRNAAKLGAIVLTLGALVAWIAPGTASSSPREARNLTFDVRFSPFHYVDLAPKGPTEGDEIVSNDVLLKNNHRVGHDGLVCSLTDLKHSEATCQVTFQLPGGIITGQFLNSPPPRKVGAITGGTGRFKRAQGQFVLVESGMNDAGTVSFDLSLPHEE